jgi:hypothetical protein
MAKTFEERFWPKVDRSGGPDACWPWLAAKNKARGGYGVVMGPVGQKLVYAHRATYALMVGEIPAGLDIDHLCRNRSCCNPAHLEPVTRKENAQRGLKGRLKTHCVNGHEYTEENTERRSKDGRRGCRTCHRKRSRDYTRRKRGWATDGS